MDLYDETVKLRTSKSRKYAVLYAVTEYLHDYHTHQRRGLAWSYPELKNGILEQEKDDAEGTTFLKLQLIEKFNKPKPAYRIGLPDNFPRKSDLTFAIESINNFMSAHFDHQSGNKPEDTITGNGSFLKNLTLLLRYGDLKEKFSSDEIPSLYNTNTSC